jgi:gluconate 5-dehydrogenase
MIDANTFRLDGRIALVTGSSTGIGLAIARGLAQAGAQVVLNGRHAARLDEAAASLRGEGLSAQTRVFDVTDADAVKAGVAEIESTVGAIDILVNNAGTTKRGPITELSHADWHLVMRTNVDSAFYVSQQVAQRMVPRKRGRIINTCSVMSDVSRPGTAAYTASKGALKMLTKGMAADLAPHGITVNGIAPGYFQTELTAAIVADEAFNQWIVKRTPMGRWGQLEELAPAAVFLASDGARFVTGTLLFVDGGLTATLG